MRNTRRGRRFPVSQAVRLAVLAALIFCHALLIHGFSVFSPRVELTGEGKPALDGIPEELHAAAETEAAAASGHSPAVLATEGDFLRYADFEMVQGAFPEREAEAAVSEETARLRFGDDSPLGRQLEAGGKAYVISGVYREKSFSRLCGVRTNAIYVRDSEAKGKTLAFFTASGTFAGQRTRDALSRAGWNVGVWQVLDLSDRLKLVRQTGALFLTFAALAAAALLAAVFACAAQRRVRSVRGGHEKLLPAGVHWKTRYGTATASDSVGCRGVLRRLVNPVGNGIPALRAAKRLIPPSGPDGFPCRAKRLYGVMLPCAPSRMGLISIGNSPYDMVYRYFYTWHPEKQVTRNSLCSSIKSNVRREPGPQPNPLLLDLYRHAQMFGL